MKSTETLCELKTSSTNPFLTEICLYDKPTAPRRVTAMVVVPDFYRSAVRNLDHQSVERHLNHHPDYFAYRCYLTADYQLLREYEHAPEIVFISVGDEGAYIRAMRVLDLLGIPFRCRERNSSHPPVVFVGEAVSANPLPFFEIADVIGLGDCPNKISAIQNPLLRYGSKTKAFYNQLAHTQGVIVTSRYRVATRDGYLKSWIAEEAPQEIKLRQSTVFSHSWYLPDELGASGDKDQQGDRLFSAEIFRVDRTAEVASKRDCSAGKSCSTHESQALISKIAWARGCGADRVELVFPTTVPVELTKSILLALNTEGVIARMGASKAEVIDSDYVALAARSNQKEISLDIESGDELLRKKLRPSCPADTGLRRIIRRSIQVGIPTIQLGMIANLPGESHDSFSRSVEFLESVKQLASYIGFKGEVVVSMPNFSPKPRTPLQFAKAGSIDSYLRKIELLEQVFEGSINLISMGGGAELLSRTLLSRGGCEVGELLCEVYRRVRDRERRQGKYTADTLIDWQAALRAVGLRAESYLAERNPELPPPWYYIKGHESHERLVRQWSEFSRSQADGDRARRSRGDLHMTL